MARFSCDFLKARTHGETLRVMAKFHRDSTPETVVCNITKHNPVLPSATLHATTSGVDIRLKNVACNIAHNVAPCIWALRLFLM